MSLRKFLSRGLVVALLSIMIMGSSVYADEIPLPKGTQLEITFDIVVSSEFARPNEQVPISVKDTVKYGGIAVILPGAKGRALVTSVTAAARGGKPGALEVTLLELDEGNPKTANGNAIKIEFVEEISLEGISKKSSCLYIGGLFRKGTEAVIKKGQSYKARTTADVVLLLE